MFDETQSDVAEVLTPATKASEAERFTRIAQAAYDKAERRGFVAGHEQADWLEAVKEVEALGEYWLP